MSVPDFEVTLRVRNNHLVARRKELGMSCAAFARSAGVDRTTYSGFETMRLSPLRKDGRGWRAVAKKIAGHHGLPCDELWPESVLQVRTPVAVRTFAAEEMRRLMPTSPDHRAVIESSIKGLRITETCSPGEVEVLQMRFEEGLTLKDAGKRLGVSKERVRQTQEIALSKLRRRCASPEDTDRLRRAAVETAEWRRRFHERRRAHERERASAYQVWERQWDEARQIWRQLPAQGEHRALSMRDEQGC